MTIFQALREDHAVQRKLASRLLETSGDSDTRRQLYQRLREEMQIHAKAEERFLYVPMLELDLTQDKARHSIAEHHEMDELLETLDTTEMGSVQWLPQFRKLHEKLFHHLEEEEHETFQLAGKGLSDPRIKQLAEDYRALVSRERKAA